MGNELSCTLCVEDGSVGPHVLFRPDEAPKSAPGTRPHEVLFAGAGQQQHSSLASGPVLQSCARPRSLPDLPAMSATVCSDAAANRAGAAAAPVHVYAFKQGSSLPASAGAPTAQVPREDTLGRSETDAARGASRAVTPFCSVSPPSSSSSLSEEEDLPW
jgi:hypothetical protein